MSLKVKKIFLAILILCGISAFFFGCKSGEKQNEKETHKIIYVLNGGEGDALGAFEEGTGLSLLPTPTKAGNTFGGWYASSDFSGAAITFISADTAADVSLYAKWNPNTYQVTYDNAAGENVTLTEGGANAVYGTDYSFTLVENGDIPATVVVTICGAVAEIAPIENIYTIQGEDIIGDIAVSVSVDCVQVTYTESDHVSYGDGVLLAEKNATFSFVVVADTGFVLTGVTVTEEDESPVPLTSENGIYSFSIAEKGITIAATVRPIRYTVAFDNGTETHSTTISAAYDQDVGLTSVETLSGFVPAHYVFKGWALTPNGEKAYDDGATVKNLALTDGETITLYAVLEAEKYEVTADREMGFEFGPLAQAEYDQDYLVLFPDADNYFYKVSAEVDGQVYDLVQDDTLGGFVLSSEYVTGEIILSGEKYVVNPVTYRNVIPCEIPDQFGNGNEYKIYATLTEEGIIFKLEARQNSLYRSGGENVLFSDGIRFQLGRKDGAAKASAGQYFGINAEGYTGGTDTSRAVAKVSGAAGAWQYTLEGLLPVSTIVKANLGYTEADFLTENLNITRVYVGMLLINFNNHKTYQDTVYSPNAQFSYNYNASWGMPVGEIGKGADDKANTSIITKNGLKSNIAKEGVDGVIREDEYGNHILNYSNSANSNYMKLYGKRTADGMRLAVQVKTHTVVYFNGASPSGCPDNVDYVQFGWYSPTCRKYVNYRLYPDGHISDSDAKYDYYLKGMTTAVVIDKTNAGGFTTKTQSNAAGLKSAESGYFITSYEIFIPNVVMDFPSEGEGENTYSEIYVFFRHRCDQIGESGDTNNFAGKDTSGSTLWFYTNRNNIGQWPEKPFATVTSNGIFDLDRTFIFDNTAEGNDGTTVSEITGTAYSGTALPMLTARVGYKFVGWSLTKDGKVFTDISVIPFAGRPNAEGKITLYAVYEEAKYSLTVNDESNLIVELMGAGDADNTTAFLGRDIVFKVNPASGEGKNVVITITIDGVVYTAQESAGTYTIKGEDITGIIVINVVEMQLAAHTVTLTSTNSVTFTGKEIAYAGLDYQFTVNNIADGYYLAVTATVEGECVAVTKVNETTYSIAGELVTGDIIITEKMHEKLSGIADFELAGFTYSGVTSEAVAIFIGNRDYSSEFSFSDGEYFISENALSALSLGENYTLIMETADKIYEQRFLLVTMVVDNLDEFRLIQSKYYKGTKIVNGIGQKGSTDESQYRDGYFVLTADINKYGEYFEFTMSPVWDTGDGTGVGFAEDKIGKRQAVSWYGTIDGRGYAVYHIAAGMGGLFGMISVASTIENIAFIDCKIALGSSVCDWNGENVREGFGTTLTNVASGGVNTGFLTRGLNGGIVRNVYIEVTEMPVLSRYGILAFAMQNNDTTLKNVVINIKSSAGNANDRHATVGVVWSGKADSVYATGSVNATPGQGASDKPTISRGAVTGISYAKDIDIVNITDNAYFTKENGKLYFGTGKYEITVATQAG